jgi:hypothetical protein
MQAQKLDNALLSLLGTGRDPRTDHPLFLTDRIAVDVEFRGQPSDADRQLVARLGGTFRAEPMARGETATIVAVALAVPSLTELPNVAKLHYGGARGGH